MQCCAQLQLAEFSTEISNCHEIAPVPPAVSWEVDEETFSCLVTPHNLGNTPLDPKVSYKSKIKKKKTQVTGFSEPSKFPSSTYYNGC